MVNLTDILSPTQMFSPENMAKLGYSHSAQQGRAGTSNDDGPDYREEGWYNEAGDPFGQQFQRKQGGDSGGGDGWIGGYVGNMGLGEYGNQLSQAGYKSLTPQMRKSMEATMRSNGFTGSLEEGIAQAYPGSQLLDDPNHGSLLQYGEGNNAGSSSLFTQNPSDGWLSDAMPYIIAGFATAGLGGFLPGTTSAFSGWGGAAAAEGVGAAGSAAASSGTPWYAGLTDMAGGSLLNPGAAGSAYAGLGEVGGALASAGTDASWGVNPRTAGSAFQGATEADTAMQLAPGVTQGVGSSTMAAPYATGGMMGAVGNLPWGKIGETLLSYGLNQQTVNSMMENAQKAASLNNPMDQPQRKQYQDQFSQLMSNPAEFYKTNPAVLAQLDLAKQQFEANSAKMGTGGTQFTDYLRNVQNAASGTFNDQANILSGAGGFTQGTGGAGSSFASMAGAAAPYQNASNFSIGKNFDEISKGIFNLGKSAFEGFSLG